MALTSDSQIGELGHYPRVEIAVRFISGFMIFFLVYCLGMVLSYQYFGLEVAPAGEPFTRTELMYGFFWQAIGIAIALTADKLGYTYDG